MKNARLILEYPHHIPFFDVDSMHIVWHGHYIKYLELARCAWLDRLDYGYAQMAAAGYGWPVAQVADIAVAGARAVEQRSHADPDAVGRLGLIRFVLSSQANHEAFARRLASVED